MATNRGKGVKERAEKRGKGSKRVRGTAGKEMREWGETSG